MNQDQFAVLTDEELRAQVKQSKTARIYDAVIFGVLIGIAIYSSVKNGFGLLTFLPLVYLPIAARNKIKYTALEKVFKERKL